MGNTTPTPRACPIEINAILCYNIDTRNAGPLKRRWPSYRLLIKDRPQPAKVTGTVFYFQQNEKIKVSNATTKVAKANINISAW